jgi:hypothetical protein
MATTVTTGMLPRAISEALSDKPSRIYIYMEYANIEGNIPTSFSTAGNITNFEFPTQYYTTLNASNRNFIRVPAIRNPIIETSTNGNESQATTVYLAQSTPTAIGVLNNGPAFGTGSICYGAALVLAPEPDDITKDLIIARSYFTGASERLTKSSASELFITFPLKINSTKAS